MSELLDPGTNFPRMRGSLHCRALCIAGPREMPGQYRRPVSTSYTSKQRNIKDSPSPYVLRFVVHHIMCRCVKLFHAAIVQSHVCTCKWITKVLRNNCRSAYIVHSMICKVSQVCRMQVIPSVCPVISLTVTRGHPATNQQRLPSLLLQLRVVALLQVFETTQAG